MTEIISVIIPMYKVAKFLPQCLNQIKAQTYKHLELIFIDDCSPDNVSEIIEQHRADFEALGMSVILCKHQVNQGVAAARNTALELASGTFIYSLDADDFIEEDALEQMLQIAVSEGADIVGCECTLQYEENERRLSQTNVRTGAEAFDKMCKGVLKWNLWLWLFRRDLLEQGENKLRFIPEQNMGEDMMMMGRLFLLANQVRIIHKPLYHYVKTNTDAQTSVYSATQWQNVKDNMLVLSDFVLERAVKREIELLNYLKLNLKLPLIISSRKEDYKHWQSLYPEANSFIMQNKELALRTRLLQKMAALNMWMLVRLYNLVVMQCLYKLLYK